MKRWQDACNNAVERARRLAVHRRRYTRPDEVTADHLDKATEDG